MELMDVSGLPFLHQYKSYVGVLGELGKKSALPFNNEGGALFFGALICHALGRRSEANHWFRRAVDTGAATAHQGFQNYVAKIKAECGF